MQQDLKLAQRGPYISTWAENPWERGAAAIKYCHLVVTAGKAQAQAGSSVQWSHVMWSEQQMSGCPSWDAQSEMPGKPPWRQPSLS